jgi:hypothetical protein
MRKHCFVVPNNQRTENEELSIRGTKKVKHLYCRCGEHEEVQFFTSVMHTSKKFYISQVRNPNITNEEEEEWMDPTIPYYQCLACNSNDFLELRNGAKHPFRDVTLTYFDNENNYALSAVGFDYFQVDGRLVAKRVEQRLVVNKQSKNIYFKDRRRILNASNFVQEAFHRMSSPYNHPAKLQFIHSLLSLLPEEHRALVYPTGMEIEEIDLQSLCALLKRPYLAYFAFPQEGRSVHLSAHVPSYYHKQLMQASTKKEVYKIAFRHDSDEFIELAQSLIELLRGIPSFFSYLRAISEQAAIRFLRKYIVKLQTENLRYFRINSIDLDIRNYRLLRFFRDEASIYRFLCRSIIRENSLHSARHRLDSLSHALSEYKGAGIPFDSHHDAQVIETKLLAEKLKQKETNIEVSYFNGSEPIARYTTRENKLITLTPITTYHQLLDHFASLAKKNNRVPSVHYHISNLKEAVRHSSSNEVRFALMHEDGELIDIIAIGTSGHGGYFYTQSLDNYNDDFFVPKDHLRRWLQNEILFTNLDTTIASIMCSKLEPWDGHYREGFGIVSKTPELEEVKKPKSQKKLRYSSWDFPTAEARPQQAIPVVSVNLAVERNEEVGPGDLPF